VTVRLVHMPEGVVALGVDATLRLTVHVEMDGLAPGGTSTLAVLAGSCLAPSATALAGFATLTADGEGAVRTDVVSQRPVAGGIPHGAVLLVQDSAGAMLACVDLPSSNATAPLRLFAPPRFKPAGTATLSAGSAGSARLAVRFDAIDLRGGGAYTVAIRSGSCQAQGTLVRTIGQLHPGDSGTASLRVTLAQMTAPPASGWYVVVVDGDAAAGAAPAGQPVLCGDVSR